MKDRAEGDNFGDMAWDNWRPRKQHLKQDVIVVAPNNTKFMHQGQVVNPTEDPLMIYRGMIFKLISCIINLRYIHELRDSDSHILLIYCYRADPPVQQT